LTNVSKKANGIILLKLGEAETKRKGETVASSMKKLQSRNNYGARNEINKKKRPSIPFSR